MDLPNHSNLAILDNELGNIEAERSYVEKKK